MKKYFSEFIGTMILVLVACGVAVITNGSILPTSLAFGLCIVALAYTIGDVSGCHVNPAVSIAMYITKKLKAKDLAGYVVAQFLGAICGSLLLGFLLSGFDSLGANSYGLNGQWASSTLIAFVVEILLTFIFVLTILGVTSKKEYKSVSGIVIGFTLALVHLLGIGFTGTSVNPARSLAPALLQGGKYLSQVWVFLTAPVVGAALAALVYQFILEKK